MPTRQGVHCAHDSAAKNRIRLRAQPAAVSWFDRITIAAEPMKQPYSFSVSKSSGMSPSDAGILPASMDDIPLDFGTLEKYGCFIGSAAIVILSQHDSVRGAALNLMRFFEDESCGQCTPCRVGTQKAAILMEKPVWNRKLLDELSQAMRDASICGLGQAASNPLASVIKYFPDEFKDAAE